ncbi:GTP diphosphokinase [Planctobacterium marinum]|uniref:GTP diphosphokinase n=1 Tax=Planctobacterium marinum TaxID=1631968 RepID=UPI001E597143|nr:GTP diphosphokinase [Planctobacterium marinum]MCC2605253.1 GTP diphosphokinase [Planctobacterium marinum]
MVSVRTVHSEIRPGFEEWLDNLKVPDSTKEKLATILEQPEILLIGQEMVEMLQELQMDDETMLASFVYTYCQIRELSEDEIAEQFSPEIQALVQGVRRMSAIRTLHSSQYIKADEGQIDNIRRMLLSMVQDVRAVVIKLAERIIKLRQVKNADEETRVMTARECASIYAPLANRLGIGQLKWELEDLSFRYLHPESYKLIAKMLREKRKERQDYIEHFVEAMQQQLDVQGIKAKVYGRPKHIYSIWKKMQNKGLTFEQLFDIRAVRIIADTLQDCYTVLGAVHASWQHIPREFDDYIATPKPNGYQSIHTVIIGPEGKTIEVQVRTQKMHDDAELGVAAHWKYKEGKSGNSDSFEDKINWLRKILAWQDDISESGDIVEELRSQVFDDRVYVFTPKGDIIDLPKGSTPLDFAYYVHTNVGHRCNGAKISGRIVPLTYQLRTGDQVEILTGKRANPSRDWMNSSMGYVLSSRARAKIATWFKKQDKDKNLQAGKDMLFNEIVKARLDKDMLNDVHDRFNVNSLEDLYVAVGGGDVGVMQVINHLQQKVKPKPDIDPRVKTKASKAASSGDQIVVEGVGNLMSVLAGCCQPLPGDPVYGYITMGRGVSVHKQDCEQLSSMLTQNPERGIEVNWSNEVKGAFKTKVDIFCYDRDGILREITTILGNEKVSLLGVHSESHEQDHTANIALTLEVKDLNSLARLMTKLEKIRNVLEVKRIEH